LTIELPSEIQRAEDFVGIEMPIDPLLWAQAGPERLSSPTARAAAANFNAFMFVSFLIIEAPGRRRRVEVASDSSRYSFDCRKLKT
jgi:hypothetical protein